MITLDAQELQRDVPVPAEFIKTYLPAAPGEYIKVYLTLLMLSVGDADAVSAEGVAKTLSCSEETVMESLRFWKQQGLVELDIRNEKLRGVSFKKVGKPKGAAGRSQESTRAALQDNEDAAQLLFVAQQYLKRPLSGNDINVLLYFLEDLKLPLDVCEYVVEYCVTKGHTNIRYIEQVGISWHEKSISSVKEAKEQNGMWDKYHYDVLKAFGIRNRDPVPKEVTFMEKWRTEYGFIMPVISEACQRTLSKTGKPSFEYTDRILASWHESKVRDFNDIKKLDGEHRSQQIKAAGRQAADSSHKEYDFKKIADEKKRRDAAYEAYPRLSEIDREVSDLSMQKARISLGLSDADDFDLEKRLSKLNEERRILLIQAGYTPEEISNDA